MKNKILLKEVCLHFLKENLNNVDPGHDILHSVRVFNLSQKIAQNYTVKNNLIIAASLLHDVADSKFSDNQEFIKNKIYTFLVNQNFNHSEIDEFFFIIENISFSKNSYLTDECSLELKIIQDADRLDAIGAIGIARAFSYGGFKNRPIFCSVNNLYSKNPEKNSTIQHFYDKLLLIKNLLNTPEAKQLAEKRHNFMHDFLNEFYSEWFLQI
ncbi:MAG: HD domain-containing protein [Bacteroidales bacterium]|jgi:uncharacterized protein|nr:HD domain-containing protein [Bacteroidales bacterium]HOL97585.1 HD domain-containing protein [Bacteroidales bacterium]HOM36726.1 HD domain-containing protein [Bacteroidales bacterium]HPD23276.1 HD domain-containing protein [Bacteroidales bacterium]HRS99000.1 HD domain-containing protein [Bacteroidales bacterium]